MYSRRKRISAGMGELLILFLLLTITVLYSVPPWRAYFFTGLADHWDPRLMGEWMAWNAHNILQGHILLPNYNANFFYPHSYTLAFSELLWPESFLYAAIYHFSHNLFLSFNATMLFFWALSGPVIYQLLREFSLSRAVCFLGAFIFCLMPYRMRYFVEFNMVLVFIIPLLIWLWIRWLRRPTTGNALWFIAGFWLAATSCLYFTIMAAIILCFISIVYLRNTPDLLHKRQFWVSTSVLAAGCTAIAGIFLYPYVLLRLNGGYTRTTADYLKHHAQAMQYLDTGSSILLRSIFPIPTPRWSETYLFPGTVLCILTLTFLVTRFLSAADRTQPVKKSALVQKGLKFTLWIIFWTTILCHAFHITAPWLPFCDRSLYAISFALLILYAADLLVWYDGDRNRMILAAMATAAVFCFFISLGPLITVGRDAIRLDIARGPFADISTWVPLFEAVRGLTRFSIVVLIYLIVAGCFTLDRLVGKNHRLIYLFPLLIALMFFDATKMRYQYVDYTDVVHSEVINNIQDLPREKVIFQMPAAERTVDATIAMATINTCPLLINGYSGFVPDDYQNLYAWEKKGWQLDKITSWLSQIWPSVYLVLDKRAINWLETGWHSPFPQNKLERDWQKISSDPLYTLYAPRREHVTDTTITRRVRTDILIKKPVLVFSAHLQDDNRDIEAHILLNNHEIKKIPVSPRWQTYRIPLPEDHMGSLTGETVQIELLLPEDTGSGNKWAVRDIHFTDKTTD